MKQNDKFELYKTLKDKEGKKRLIYYDLETVKEYKYKGIFVPISCSIGYIDLDKD